MKKTRPQEWLLDPRPLSERKVLVGIPQGEWIPKACALLRKLRGGRIPAQAILTPEITNWATPRLFRDLTDREPLLDEVRLSARLEEEESLPGDVMVVVGATPQIVSRIAKGIPDDAVSLAALTFRGPILLVPGQGRREGSDDREGGNSADSRDEGEWESPIVRENLDRLTDRGVLALRGEEPGGPSAEEIVSELVKLLLQRESGVPVLVTAGGTREPLDPVRYLSNRSSGRTGCAIAEAARDGGHQATLIRGPGRGVPTPAGVEEICVETAQDMLQALRKRHKRFPILIMAAAVADYRPTELSTMKIRRDREERELKLAANPDILSALRDERRDLVTIGFAIEGGLDKAALRGAKKKLEAKGLDLIVLNDPQRPDTAFGGPTARVRILWNPSVSDQGVEDLRTLTKEELGRQILRRALSVLARRYGI